MRIVSTASGCGGCHLASTARLSGTSEYCSCHASLPIDLLTATTSVCGMDANWSTRPCSWWGGVARKWGGSRGGGRLEGMSRCSP